MHPSPRDLYTKRKSADAADTARRVEKHRMTDTSQAVVYTADEAPRKLNACSPTEAGAKIAAARKGRGMTLGKLADLVRVTPTHLCRVEHGERPSAELLDAIARVLDLDPAPLFCAWRIAPARAASFWDADRMREALAGGGA